MACCGELHQGLRIGNQQLRAPADGPGNNLRAAAPVCATRGRQYTAGLPPGVVWNEYCDRALETDGPLSMSWQLVEQKPYAGWNVSDVNNAVTGLHRTWEHAAMEQGLVSPESAK